MLKKAICLFVLISSYQCYGISERTASASKLFIGTGLGLHRIVKTIDSYADTSTVMFGCACDIGIHHLASYIIDRYTPACRFKKALEHIKDMGYIYPSLVHNKLENHLDHKIYETCIDQSHLNDESLIQHIYNTNHLTDIPV
jgi:hypothetical protein